MVAVAEEFIITGWFDYGDHRDAVLTEFRECARRSRDEPGCLDYWVSADSEDAGLIRVFERWESEAHLAEHFTTEHVTGFRTAIAPYPRKDRDVRRYFISRGEQFQSSRPAAE